MVASARCWGWLAFERWLAIFRMVKLSRSWVRNWLMRVW